MRSFTYLITLSLMTISIFAEAAPRRSVVQRDRSRSEHADSSRRQRRPEQRSTPARRRVIEASPVSHRSPERRVVSPPGHRQGLQRGSSARAAQQHRQSRRVERRQARRAERRHSRRFEQRKARRHQRQIRRGHRRVRNLHGYRGRFIPTYVSTPTRVIVTHRDRPHHNDDRFFDHIYHDGERYGVNNDLRDEEQRINRGIRLGLITPREADRLFDLLFDAYDLETECIADGYLTRKEEAELYWSERELNRAIRWEMRDFEVW